jgi:NTE family protein
VFREGPLMPALRASTAIPGVFPAVRIDGTGYLDGGIVDNMPIGLALEGGEREVLGIDLMAGETLERPPESWSELMSRTLQLILHQRMLSEFARVRNSARVVVLCPVLGPSDGLDKEPKHVQDLIDRARSATARLLATERGRLFRRSAVHYLPLSPVVAD